MRAVIAILLLLSTSALAARQELTGPTTFYVATTGNDSNVCSSASQCRTIQRVIDYICGSVDTRGFPAMIQVADGAYREVATISSYCVLFIKGNHATPRNVVIDGLQVRDHSTVLFYDLALPWVLLSQGAIVDGYDFVLIAGPAPAGAQIFVGNGSTFNANNYSIDAGNTGHVLVGPASVFGQPGNSVVTLGNWIAYTSGATVMPFYNAKFGGVISLGPNITYTNGNQTTAIPADVTDRGIVIKSGNTLPGSTIWKPNVGDGLLK